MKHKYVLYKIVTVSSSSEDALIQIFDPGVTAEVTRVTFFGNGNDNALFFRRPRRAEMRSFFVSITSNVFSCFFFCNAYNTASIV